MDLQPDTHAEQLIEQSGEQVVACALEALAEDACRASLGEGVGIRDRIREGRKN